MSLTLAPPLGSPPARPSPHLTSVAPDEVAAGGTVLAWIGRTLVKLLLAVAARVAQGALAVMGVASIDTDARVLAQVFNGHAWDTAKREASERARPAAGSTPKQVSPAGGCSGIFSIGV